MRASAGGIPPGAAQRLPSGTPPSWLRMVGGRTGWGLAGGHIYRTSDGGATRVDETPAGGTVAAGSAGAAFPGKEVAFVEMAPRRGSGTPVTLAKTVNGGASWTPLRLPAAAPDGLQLSLPTPRDGWALAHVGAGAGHDSVVLFSTADGGATWRRILATSPTGQGGLPDSGFKVGLTFQSPTTGWITGYANWGGPYLYVTRDGGTTWTAQTPDLPPALAAVSGGGNLVVLPPVSLGPMDAVLPVCAGEAGRGVLVDFYVTHDGGRTWNGTGLLPLRAVRLCVRLHWSFAGPTHGWVADGGGLYATADGGRRWTPSPLSGAGVAAIREVDFVSPADGWLLATSTAQRPMLLRTTDGGHAWRALAG